jgi:hypothetical protein
MANYFEAITDNFIEQEDDKSWIDFIYAYLIFFYEKHKADRTYKDKTENQITESIFNWLNNTKKFRRKMVVNSQPRTNNMEIEGYYDLKFQSNLWRENDIHFAIENKLLINSETSFKEYIYFPNKSKGKGENKKIFDDGGMFRFLSNKYGDKQPYGGMLAFIKESNIPVIIDNVKNKIKNLTIFDNNNKYGQFIDEELLELKILDFENSFQSNHLRKDGTEIHLLHLFFKF